ncbi:MAG: hypothetical protein DSY41_02185 [Candidatus Poseidoniales archaeon]|nr:MAG: hypothetical protein DSY41_02185 [Candidatus Poseidoniales archaeon]
MMRSRAAVLAVIALLLATSAGVANPGGESDAGRDYTCGGSCHGDPALSSPSDGTVTISVDSMAFTGTAIAIHVTASGMSLSGNRLLGVFLLGSANGNDDRPEDHGWHILQDPNGGLHNYVLVVVPPSGSITLTWVMLAPEHAGMQNLFASIHHGVNPNPNNWAYSALTMGYSVDVQPVPENLPGFSFDWTPEMRVTGDDSPTFIRTKNATSVSVQWMLDGEWVPHDAEAQMVEDDVWAVMLPATIGDTRMQYQVTTSNGEFSIVQPWLTVGTKPPPFDGGIWDARLQSLAFAFLVLAFLVALQTRLSPWEGRPELDHTEEVEVAQAEEVPPPPPGLEPDPADDYWSRLVSSEEAPGWLWDPVEEEWVADPENPPGGDD